MTQKERNELNADLYKDAVKLMRSEDLKALVDIDATLDKIKDEIRHSDNGSYFSEIGNSLDNLVAQTFELNKTMNNIAESLRVISHNNR
tara:strand:- start:1266 stop:1532 length:267 start_codon:yes stop_codon:yes gene_type:complete